MAILLVFLLMGVVGSKIPTDADIAAQIATAIRGQLAPKTVNVVVHRPSPLSTTLNELDIDLSGFTLANLPSGALAGPAAGAPIKGRQVHIRHTHLHGEDFTAMGMPIYRAEIDLSDVVVPLATVSSGGLHIASAGAASGYVTLQQSGLTSYLQTKKLPLDESEVIITQEGCRIRGMTQTAISLPIELEGRLAVRNGAVLYLENPHLRVSVVPVPAFIANRVLKRINPLVDLNADMKLPVHVNITKTTHGDGWLRFDAEVNMAKEGAVNAADAR